VVNGGHSITVHNADGSSTSARIIAKDLANDLALLQINKDTPDYLDLAQPRSVALGDKVFTIGFPVSSLLGQSPKFTEGSVSSLKGLKDTASLMQISTPIQPGNSGGPLITEDGRVVGVITSAAAIPYFIKVTGTIPQNVNWAVKTDYLRPLLDKPPPLRSPLRREAAIKQARNAVVEIECKH
jgi:S1-C subfamily serine protease